MKITLTFDSENQDDMIKYRDTLKATDMSIAIRDIAEEVFRPHRKHGYSNEELQNLSDETLEAIGKLEEIFYSILKDRNIDIYE